jgi:hypothetical protein
MYAITPWVKAIPLAPMVQGSWTRELIATNP